MAIKAYKGLMGSFVPMEESDKKHEFTHVIMERQEYIEIREEMKQLRNQLQEEQQKLERLKGVAETRIREIKEAATSEMESCRSEAEQVKDEALRLNENLKRICKERANAARNLQPKKRHCGYIAKRSEQSKKVFYEKGKRSEVDVWRTFIETPYQIQLVEVEARKFIDSDIGEKGVFDFAGGYYTDFKMIKDLTSGLWNIALETEGEFSGVVGN